MLTYALTCRVLVYTCIFTNTRSRERNGLYCFCNRNQSQTGTKRERFVVLKSSLLGFNTSNKYPSIILVHIKTRNHALAQPPEDVTRLTYVNYVFTFESLSLPLSLARSWATDGQIQLRKPTPTSNNDTARHGAGTALRITADTDNGRSQWHRRIQLRTPVFIPETQAYEDEIRTGLWEAGEFVEVCVVRT